MLHVRVLLQPVRRRLAGLEGLEEEAKVLARALGAVGGAPEALVAVAPQAPARVRPPLQLKELPCRDSPDLRAHCWNASKHWCVDTARRTDGQVIQGLPPPTALLCALRPAVVRYGDEGYVPGGRRRGVGRVRDLAALCGCGGGACICCTPGLPAICRAWGQRGPAAGSTYGRVHASARPAQLIACRRTPARANAAHAPAPALRRPSYSDARRTYLKPLKAPLLSWSSCLCPERTKNSMRWMLRLLMCTYLHQTRQRFREVPARLHALVSPVALGDRQASRDTGHDVGRQSWRTCQARHERTHAHWPALARLGAWCRGGCGGKAKAQFSARNICDVAEGAPAVHVALRQRGQSKYLQSSEGLWGHSSRHC